MNERLPANLLGLPPEVRQNILYESFDDACKQDIQFSTNVNILDSILDVRRPLVHFLPHIHRHAANLASVHDTLSDDLEFVMKQILAACKSGIDEELQGVSYYNKLARWTILATEIQVGGRFAIDEDDDILHHRRFQMVQDMREALGADTSQFSFDEDTSQFAKLPRR